MEHTCKIIQDLLPLYLDNMCSTESRLLVETHIAECDSCRHLLEELQADLPDMAAPVLAAEDDILKRTSLRIHKRAVGSAVGITAIVLYWLIYFWQSDLATLGDYRYFSYGFHELYTCGYMLVPLITAIWLIVVLVRSRKRHTMRKNALLLLILIFLLGAQGVYHVDRAQTVSTTSWTDAKEIPDPYHVVIETGDGPVVLETTPIVTTLLQTNSTIYGFWYECDRDNPAEGTLLSIWGSHPPSSDTDQTN